MKTTYFALLLLLLTACASSPSTYQPYRMSLNQRVTTTHPEQVACVAPARPVCEEVLGSRIESRVLDCICL